MQNWQIQKLYLTIGLILLQIKMSSHQENKYLESTRDEIDQEIYM